MVSKFLKRLDDNADAFDHGWIDHKEFSTRQGAAWRAIKRAGARSEVQEALLLKEREVRS